MPAYAANSGKRPRNRLYRSDFSLGDANTFRSIPVTQVAFHSGHMGNTFRQKGFPIGSRRHVSSSKYPKS
jgi:hypothetical protein